MRKRYAGQLLSSIKTYNLSLQLSDFDCRGLRGQRLMTRLLVAFGFEVAQAVAAQLHVQALPAQAEHFGGRCTVVAGQLECGLDAQPLDQVSRFAHESLRGTRPTSSVNCSTDRGSSRPARESADSRRPTLRMVKPRHGWSPCGTDTAEISTSAVDPYSPRSVVANRRTAPCWRRLAISTLRSTPGRPSHRSSDSPRACSSVASCARSRNAGFAVRMRPAGR